MRRSEEPAPRPKGAPERRGFDKATTGPPGARRPRGDTPPPGGSAPTAPPAAGHPTAPPRGDSAPTAPLALAIPSAAPRGDSPRASRTAGVTTAGIPPQAGCPAATALAPPLAAATVMGGSHVPNEEANSTARG